MERLPRGRHGLSPAYVAFNQRERLIAAIVESLATHGYERTTVEWVGRRAGVSKSDFYKRFSTKDAGILAAYDDSVERIRKEVAAACKRGRDWAGGVCSGLAALLSFFAAEPMHARFVLIEGLRAGQEVYDRFQEALESFAVLLRDGAPEVDDEGRAPAVTDSAVVGGVASLLGRQVSAGRTAQLEELLPDIAEFALTPYVGGAEARRIISDL